VATVSTTGAGGPPGRRFLQLADVAEVLNTSAAQVYALVRSGELPAIKIGGRGQWRVEARELEDYIARMYQQTREFVTTHQFGRPSDEQADPGSTDPDESFDEAAGGGSARRRDRGDG